MSCRLNFPWDCLPVDRIAGTAMQDNFTACSTGTFKPFTEDGRSRSSRGAGTFRTHRRIAAALLLLTITVFTGCAPVGPDYTPPQDNAPDNWHTELGSGAIPAKPDSSKLASWWTTLNDPVLTRLIEEAVKNNPDLRQAIAKVREARARRGISESSRFPVLDASGSARRSKSSENSGSGSTRSFYSVGFDAGWEIDIFGGLRRSVEAAEADLGASRENLSDALVSLTAEVALNYLDLRILQARLTVAEKNFALQQETFDLTRSRYQAGLSNELALQQARYNLENTGAQIPALRSSTEEAKNLLAVLTGTVPGSLHKMLADRQPVPVPPPTIAVGVPAETLRRRPDIRRAERNLAAQTARIGVATSELYPKFRLAGSIGLEATHAGDLFKTAAETWSIGPGISWNIFDAGSIRRNIEVQGAIQEQYLAAYEKTVLEALAEVENAITAYTEEQLRRDRLSAAAAAARQAEKLAMDQYSAGLEDYSTVLEAQRSLLSFEDQVAQSNGIVTTNLIRLYKALGGGWDTSAVTNILAEDTKP